MPHVDSLKFGGRGNADSRLRYRFIDRRLLDRLGASRGKRRDKAKGHAIWRRLSDVCCRFLSLEPGELVWGAA